MRNMELKVFSGAALVNGKQVHVILAASSQRGAVAALHGVGLDVSVRHLTTYWRVTGNEQDRAIALASPGKVLAASSLQSSDFKPLPPRPLAKVPQPPKVPTDPEARKRYDVARRADSDEAKRARGERRLTTWLPKEAAEALDRLTGGSKERGAVQAALVLALTTCAAQQGTKAA